ncbi:MAG: type IV pilus secretin PilQ [Acidobacteriota bacterium]|nr:type IV pilus secretin PilQ [Acidobacteriota bacterium]
MARTLVRFSLPAALFLTLLAAGSQSLPTVDSIGIAAESGFTRVVLQASVPLTPIAAAYTAAVSPAELRLEFGPGRWPEAPGIPGGEALLRGLRVETKPNARIELVLTLAERVSYRVFSEGPRTIIELLKFRRGTADYTVGADVKKALAGADRTVSTLGSPAVTKPDGRLEIAARLGRPGTAAVFALDNPLRLVVDVFDAVYDGPTETRPVGLNGVESMRVGQFMSGSPYAIARLVFDLREAGPYSLAASADGIRIGFGPFAPSAPFVAAVPVPAFAEAEPAPKPVQAQAPAQVRTEKAASQTIVNPERKYSGERYSPKFKDADIRDVILWLGEEVGLNVIFDDEVKGTVTCSFDDIPWDQFLDIILRNKKLGKTLEGNVLRIAPMGTLATEQVEEQKLLDAREQGGPLIAKTYTLSYAKAREIEPLVKTKKSARGEITVDDRTNTLLLVDTKEKLDMIEKLIAVLDTPTPQVVIEARIVEATSNFVRNLGVQWGTKAISDPYYGNQTSLQFPNKVSVDGALIPEGTSTKGIGGPLGGYAVNLPATSFSSAIGLSFANVLDTFRLDIALTAMETKGEGKIISSTKVTALNNKEAEVIQGRQIPVQTTANFTVTTQFFNAALQLKATPQITADGSIIMALDIQNNAADFSNLVNGIPPITTQSAKTQVMVPDGGTTVIGGISRMEDSITRERVPFLHQIPILGSLFKNFARTKTTRELLIFITPRILK